MTQRPECAALGGDPVSKTNDVRVYGTGDRHDREMKRLVPNAAFAVAQTVVSTCLLFYLYRYLIRELGAEALGVWTILMAATSVANISNLGITGGLVRFVSGHLAQGQPLKAAASIETSVLTLAAFIGAMALLVWMPISWGLGWVVEGKWLAEANAILPFSILALWLSTLGSSVNSALDGCHRADLRSISTMLSQPILFAGALVFVPSHGLKGLAIAQLIQFLFWTALGWFLLRREIPSLPVLPYRWEQERFFEMWRYGVNFQVISVLLLFSEPLAKGTLSHFTNLSTVGYFEVANRLVVQARSLLVSANQVATPYYASIQSTDSSKLGSVYLHNLRVVAVTGRVLFAFIITAAPLLSWFWIGHLERQFLWFLVMLSVGWFVNTLAAPAYFANLGIANMAPNVDGHFAMVLGIVICAAIFGSVSKPYGIAAAWPVGLVLCSWVTTRGLLKNIGISCSDWAGAAGVLLLVAHLSIGTAAAWLGAQFLDASGVPSVFASCAVVAVSIAALVSLNISDFSGIIRGYQAAFMPRGRE
jgi:O-antigen/teichoic acid export membrane protein